MVKLHRLNSHMLIFPPFCPSCSKTSHQNSLRVFLLTLRLSTTFINILIVSFNSFVPCFNHPLPQIPHFPNRKSHKTTICIHPARLLKVTKLMRSKKKLQSFTEHVKNAQATFQMPKPCWGLPNPLFQSATRSSPGISFVIQASSTHHLGQNC